MIKQNVERLSPKEVKYLNRLILGYGMLTNASRQSGVIERTIKNIATKGHGTTENIDKLRNTILLGIEPKVENINEMHNTAA